MVTLDGALSSLPSLTISVATYTPGTSAKKVGVATW
jgi:hypothetical protein